MRQQLKRIDWEAVAGILAAVFGLVLHFLHIVEESVLLMITLVLLSLLFLRDLRRESETEELTESVEQLTQTANHTERTVGEIQSALTPTELELIGPGDLRAESQQFGRNAHGEIIWFNVCLLMFNPQDLFDTLLRPAIENPNVTSIQFILDESERERWETEVKPKVQQCMNSGTVREPIWGDLEEDISFILAGTESGGTNVLLSFWGKPFMARTTRNVPRYIIFVHEHSELLAQLRDIEREYRLQTT